MTEVGRAASSLAALAAVVLGVSPTTGPPANVVARLPPAGFTRIDTGPDGGTVWQGVIPDRVAPKTQLASVVYLPPGASGGMRYPVLYLLQGFRGSPWQFSQGLRLASYADSAIADGSTGPFIAVAPPAGVTQRFHGEWAGPWEEYLVRDVVPWVDSHLPVDPSASARTLAGLSAGGYGAVDIGLRHPLLFGTLESWSGYFRPNRDGVLRDAGPLALARHDPMLLVQREAPLLRRLGTRFYLSSGTTFDRTTAADARSFARELSGLRLPYELVLQPGGHDGRFWRRQLPAALRFAVPVV